MIIAYGYATPEATIDVVDSFSEAVATGHNVWILADGSPLRCLPSMFNREVVVDDNTLRSSVLLKQEFVGGWAQESAGFFPLGALAPTLTLDFNNDRVLWKQNGETRVLYDEAVG